MNTIASTMQTPDDAKRRDGAGADPKLDELLNRIKQMAESTTSGRTARSAPSATTTATSPAETVTAIPATTQATPSAELPLAVASDLKSIIASAPPLVPSTVSGSNASSVSEVTEDLEFDDEFYPNEPKSFREARLNEVEAEIIALKYLLSAGAATGREVADQLKLSFKLVDDLMFQLKSDQLVVYRNASIAGDYLYQLTEKGREKARRLVEHCTYYGSAPVHLNDYIASVHRQSLTRRQPSVEDLERAFEDLLINKRMLGRIGPAINSGRGLFLFGAPGNGKTSIAERITKSFGDSIWIPRAISIDGEIIRLFDPCNHEVVPHAKGDGLIEEVNLDRRWVQIRRPTIIAGGELTMDSLEVTMNSSTGVSEAPLQLKSNCGTLVIDDFGRQRMSVDVLLNRWIVPLEKRYDFLNLPNGKKIQVPFDQLIVFSTNLEPKQLVDDAFLRRIPYKIEVCDPSEEEYRELMKIMAAKLGFDFVESAVDYLIETHYRRVKRPFRACQPRDLLLQIKNMCLYLRQPVAMSPTLFDSAVDNYFAVM